VTISSLEALAARYEEAESAFLGAVRGGASCTPLSAAARAVATAAAAYNTAAYARYRQSTGDERAELSFLTERTELLAELWSDLGEAYEQQK
jgi:hypothetical protein